MKKIVIERPGGYGRLKITPAQVPEPKNDEVLIDVTAAGVNFADIFIRLGLYSSAREYVGWPITPGFEVSGYTLDSGNRVDDLPTGTPVVGVTRFGGYASHICIPRQQVYPIRPDSKFNLAQWAGVPTVFLTAYHGLFQNIVLRPEMTILVHSAAGGVGSALLQLGKIAGCRMIGVVGASHKTDICRACGADVVIDKSRQNLWDSVERTCPDGCDVVFDANGPATLRQSYTHLAPTGKLVIYGFHTMLSRKGHLAKWAKLVTGYLRIPRWNPLKMTRDNRSIITFNLSYLFHRQDLLSEAMATLIDWIEAGRIKAPPIRSFPLDRVADAHRALESGHTVGKLILKP